MTYSMSPAIVLTALVASSLPSVRPKSAVVSVLEETSPVFIVALRASCFTLLIERFSADAADPVADTYLLFTPLTLIWLLEKSFEEVRLLDEENEVNLLEKS